MCILYSHSPPPPPSPPPELPHPPILHQVLLSNTTLRDVIVSWRTSFDGNTEITGYVVEYRVITGKYGDNIMNLSYNFIYIYKYIFKIYIYYLVI